MTTRKQMLEPSQAEALLGRYAAWTVHEPSAQDVMRAIRLHRKILASCWDSMILTSAARLVCAVLWSEDLNAGQSYGGVTVPSPFAVRAQ